MITSFQGPSADSAWQRVAEAFRQSVGIQDQDSRDGATKEILHAAISISDPRQRWVVSREPPLNIAFALAEVVWIMTGRRDLKFLTYWNSELPKYVGPGPDLHGAYGYRLRQHFGIDQLDRAYQSLKHNPDGRQVVLQLWDPSIDMPQFEGKPVDQDVPCNTSAMLKVRDGKLEWMQVLRSNDMFLGAPHNLVQFTSVQEVIAGWLEVECGSYNQISDSLHVYDRDWENVARSMPVVRAPANTDELAQPRQASTWLFSELERRIELMASPETEPDAVEALSSWDAAPQAYVNIATVLTAEALRRRGLRGLASKTMTRCTNPIYQQLWSRWYSSRPRRLTANQESATYCRKAS